MNIINTIITEWSYKVDNGQPDVSNKQHITILQNYLIENNYPSEFISEFMSNLTEVKNSDSLLDAAIKNNKQNQYKNFKSKLPGGETVTAIEKYLTGLSKNDLTKFFKLLGKYKSVDKIKPSDYSSGIGKTLMDMQPAGVGKGEVMIAVMVDGSKISGGSESYDITVGGKKYEVKDYRSRPMSSSIRLGTHGKLTKFTFWRQITKTMDMINQFDLKKIETSLGDAGSDIITGIKAIKDISDKVGRGELASYAITNLEAFYQTANSFVNEVGDGFNQITLRGPNIKPTDLMVKMVDKKDITGKNISFDVIDDKSGKDTVVFMNDLRKLKYVRKPKSLWVDIHDAVKEIDTKAYSGINFIVFRKSKIMIQGRDFKKLKFGTITQGAIKVLEDI